MILFSSLFRIIFWNIISSVLGVTIVFKHFSLEMISVIDPGTWWSVVSSHCQHCHHQHNTNCHNIVTKIVIKMVKIIQLPAKQKK